MTMTQNITAIPELDNNLFFIMGQAYKQFRTLANHALSNECDITLEMLCALRALNHLGSIPQQQLAETLKRERSATKRLVDNCIKRGLIKSEKSMTNRKTRLLCLTEKGVNVKNKADDILPPIVDDFCTPLTAAEKAVLLKLSKKLIKAQALH